MFRLCTYMAFACMSLSCVPQDKRAAASERDFRLDAAIPYYPEPTYLYREGSSDATAAEDPIVAGFAQLRITELSATMASQCDLIELQVIKSGLGDGLVLKQRQSPLFAFDGIGFELGQVVLVHLNKQAVDCGYQGQETWSEPISAEAHKRYVDGALDVFSDVEGLVATDNVISVWNQEQIQDAVLLTGKEAGNAAQASETAAALVAAQGQWENCDGGVPASGFVDDLFHQHAVYGLSNTATDGADSIAAEGADDYNCRHGWIVTALANFGKSNWP